jgi:hypothetical protein
MHVDAGSVSASPASPMHDSHCATLTKQLGAYAHVFNHSHHTTPQVVSAGNLNGANACNYSPAGVVEAITVGASNQTDQKVCSCAM